MDPNRPEHARGHAHLSNHPDTFPYQYSDTDSEHHANPKQHTNTQTDHPPDKYTPANGHAAAPGGQACFHHLESLHVQV